MQEKLPQSKIVQVLINKSWTGASVYGEDDNAVGEASVLLMEAGFHPTLARAIA